MDPETSLTRDFLLTLIERSDVRRLANGHYRLVLPMTAAELDDLATLGTAVAEMEDDDPGEEQPDREPDGTDEPDLGWSIGFSGAEPFRAPGTAIRIRDEFDFEGCDPHGMEDAA
ncbi:MAG: hypothetical protein V7704_22680 [Aurantimonas endophytica]|uniref:hypothetical protein n=1 Tax=Aurantimonas endophytica TaxID=1522175 RepID=UPI003002DBF1